jgi:hypothetical protein
MEERKHVLYGAVSGVGASLLVILLLIVFWPGVTPALPSRPTAMILPSETPTAVPAATATPNNSAQIAGPSESIGAFGDQ